MKASECLLFLIMCILVLAALGSKAETTQEEPVIEPPTREVETQRDTLSEWQLLQLAIIMTESKGDPNAVGKSGDFGIYQMTEPYVREVNRISGANFAHEDAFDINSSIEMFALLQGHYNADKDIELALRYHNKSSAYRATVLRNLEIVERMELCRRKLIEYGE